MGGNSEVVGSNPAPHIKAAAPGNGGTLDLAACASADRIEPDLLDGCRLANLSEIVLHRATAYAGPTALRAKWTGACAHLRCGFPLLLCVFSSVPRQKSIS